MARSREAPTISIIVTFYNIANCVDYCLRSVLSQEYKDYEVICVDDGSTDETFEELMRFADLPHVRVIRQVNSGPSKARNTGIKYSKGEYLTFIDGDDIVSPYYLSTLIDALRESKADMAIGGIAFQPADDLENAAEQWVRPSEFILMTRNELAESILCQYLGVSGAARLAPRNFYNESFFPEGHFHEDISTIMDLIGNATTIIRAVGPIYKYVQREGSNMHGFVSLDKRSSDLILAIDHLTDKCTSFGIDRSYIELYRCLACLRLHANGGNYIPSKDLQHYVRSHLSIALKCKDARSDQRLSLRCFALSIGLYDLLRKIHARLARQN